MKFIKTPIKGTCDYLPSDMRLREAVLSIIKETYSRYGFSQIETPIMEHIENLTSKQGGDNEKLIFQIMKRGADLQRALEKEQGDLSDSGLRYDLTVPLARYYANNKSLLNTPFKSLQIGNVFRADKPQKGRFRQFIQCDIDILGDNTILAEIELIAATATALSNIFKENGLNKFTVHVNDRRLLKAMCAYGGFEENDYNDILISLDKLDKIGLDGVKTELQKKNYEAEQIERFIGIFNRSYEDESCSSFCEFLKNEYIDLNCMENLDGIISCTKDMVSKDISIIYDPTLVRGMSYYTGTIFEISIDNYNFSIGGGGRYDEMIGKFSGEATPACGFSLGFERIITILKDLEAQTKLKEGKNSIAILVDKNCTISQMSNILKEATLLREQGNIVAVQPMNKNMKFQIENLEKDGFTDIRKVYKD